MIDQYCQIVDHFQNCVSYRKSHGWIAQIIDLSKDWVVEESDEYFQKESEAWEHSSDMLKEYDYGSIYL